MADRAWSVDQSPQKIQRLCAHACSLAATTRNRSQKNLEKPRRRDTICSQIKLKNMNWIKPEFEEISLSMEVTAYVNAGK
jgi:coenzyme PQQ precursor peptide PqqA